jgi:hypothetical protein
MGVSSAEAQCPSKFFYKKIYIETGRIAKDWRPSYVGG